MIKPATFRPPPFRPPTFLSAVFLSAALPFFFWPAVLLPVHAADMPGLTPASASETSASASETEAPEASDSGMTDAADMLLPEEQEFIEKVNAERRERGLTVLALDPLLARTARAHSREMAARGYFSHHSPVPGLATPLDRFLAGLHGLGDRTRAALLVGENIYYCSVSNDVYDTDYAHRALMGSPGHRANILEPRFTRIGLGIYRSPAGGFWVTQMFSRGGE